MGCYRGIPATLAGLGERGVEQRWDCDEQTVPARVARAARVSAERTVRYVPQLSEESLEFSLVPIALLAGTYRYYRPR